MQVVHSFAETVPYRGCVAAIGNFDGVHRGHQSMLERLRFRADERKAPALILTFDPPPIELLRPADAPPRVTTLSRRLELLSRFGAEACLVYRTDSALLSLTAREFFDSIVLGQLAAVGLVEGPNFFFGKGRGGNVQVLQEWCPQHDLSIDVVDSVHVDDVMVSSSEIRRRLTSGDARGAAAMLGRPHRISGRVVRGDQRGRTIGFPTANLAEVAVMLPRDGVYACVCTVDGAVHTAIMNIGPNPTFGEQRRKLEVHLLDFHGDLYGRELHVDLVERLRETRAFSGVEALVAQLTRDATAARLAVAG
jgi:riboflavin kinase/FMN adenylyltransferase